MSSIKSIKPLFKTQEGPYRLIRDESLKIDRYLRKFVTNITPRISYYDLDNDNEIINNNNNNNINSNSSTNNNSSISSNNINDNSDNNNIKIGNSNNNESDKNNNNEVIKSSMASFIPIEEYAPVNRNHQITNNININNQSNNHSNNHHNNNHSNNSSIQNNNNIQKEKIQLYFTNFSQLSLFSFTNIEKAEFINKNPAYFNYNLVCQKIKKSKKNILSIIIGTDSGEILFLEYQDKPILIRVFNKDSTSPSPNLNSINNNNNINNSNHYINNQNNNYNYNSNNNQNNNQNNNRKLKCLCLEWVPNCDDQFIAGFDNGQLMVFDLNRNDQSTQQQQYKGNPIDVWEICNKKKINSISFSPNGKYLAVACQDSLLRVYDYNSKNHLVSYETYFGGILSVDWSPDGEFLVTGGEDDYLSIWSFGNEYKLVTRGQGHQSWVGCVKFDPFIYQAGSNHYRIVSGGEDTRLLLWDFSKESGTKKRGKSFSNNNSNSNNNSDSLSIQLAFSKFNIEQQQLQEKEKLQQHQNQQKQQHSNSNSPVFVKSISRSVCPIIYPIVSHRAHSDPVCDLLCTKDWIITVGFKNFSIWARPITVATAQKIDSVMSDTPSSFTEQVLKMDNSSWKK